MKTILTMVTYEEVIKSSKFISVLIPVCSKNDVKNALNEIKVLYPKANHYCYAYILEDDQGMSDDGEPAKTAGSPMYTVLEKEEFMNVLVIVVRYFGGIKLGPGGLIRAYSHGVQSVIKSSETIELIKGFKLSISFSFSNENKILYFLKPSQILTKSYDTMCHYVIEVEKSQIDSIKNLATIEKSEEVLIKKID